MTIFEILACVGLGVLCVMLIVMFAAMAKLYELIESVKDLDCRVASLGRRIDNTYDLLESVQDDVLDVKDDINAKMCKPAEPVCGEVSKSCDDTCAKGDEDEIDIHLIKPYEYHFNGNMEYCDKRLVYDVKTNEVSMRDGTWNDAKQEWGRYVLDNTKEVIGDALMFFGINPKEPHTVYVRNHKLKYDFRIDRVGYEGDKHEE